MVDDQDALRGMFSEFLVSKGMATKQAENGLKCLEQVALQTFEAIFLDVRMPTMDGLETLSILREQGVNAVIILMSGFDTISSMEEAKQNGADGFLAKPFKPESAFQLLGNIQMAKAEQLGLS